jgi:hypothetical protein
VSPHTHTYILSAINILTDCITLVVKGAKSNQSKKAKKTKANAKPRSIPTLTPISEGDRERMFLEMNMGMGVDLGMRRDEVDGFGTCDHGYGYEDCEMSVGEECMFPMDI